MDLAVPLFVIALSWGIYYLLLRRRKPTPKA